MGPLDFLFHRPSLEQARGRLYRLAYAWCHEVSLAEDLVQETLARAVARSGQVRSDGPLAAWLVAILSNCWRDHLRRTRDHLDLDEAGDLPSPVEGGPEEACSRGQVVDWVRQAVACLPPLGAAVAKKDDKDADLKKLTLIHIGNIHGHMVPRPNLRSDARGNRPEGGLARMYAKIEEIRRHAGEECQAGEETGRHGKKHPEKHPKKCTLLLNTGDTIQGSAEALYTRGQALVDVLNAFDIEAFAPGNWEFLYGTERFKEMFAGRRHRRDPLLRHARGGEGPGGGHDAGWRQDHRGGRGPGRDQPG